ncbi:MAG: hypothetical protein JWM71_773 [Solirubrobacteraceae bacterium]|nr:hypothetical protein [Solirubrobacteraceae bacterium]
MQQPAVAAMTFSPLTIAEAAAATGLTTHTHQEQP